jgi:hypothetical protein
MKIRVIISFFVAIILMLDASEGKSIFPFLLNGFASATPSIPRQMAIEPNVSSENISLNSLALEIESLQEKNAKLLKLINQLNEINGELIEEVNRLDNRVDALTKLVIVRGEQLDALTVPSAEKHDLSLQIPVNSNSSAIESKIDGEFNGWNGETIFKLTNGQIWQQSSYAYTYHYAYMPKVTIYKINNKYKMIVEGVKGSIEVKQIK